MSCNGCRVLRKGCSDSCILRPCLQWIEGAEAQGHATVFVAKFFGRAGLMNFISSVPDNQRPALFQSLLYEACGRTINPVFGAVGLLWSGKWHLCQAAVEAVLKGCSLQPVCSVGAPQPTILPPSNFRASPDSVLHGALEDWPQWSNKRVFTGKLKARKQSENVKREWRPSTDIVVPVPRRIRPRFDTECVSTKEEGIDLDLSLGHHTKKESLEKRVHSPCQSLTSEGSVTSVDSGEFKMSLRGF